ncbi:MAG: queuosine precursor transporter [Verrucomicrobia bacterium]|nr:queuosine precursor transporter [Verrucomicrobiota bacterium]
MNEAIFFIHILVLILFTYLALRVGREALLALCALEWVLANLFVTKGIVLFSLHVTPTDAYAIASLLGSNLLQEYFGREEAKKSLRISLVLLLFFTAMSIFQIGYLPSSLDEMDGAFRSILMTTPRIALSSIISFLVTQRVDIELFGYLRKRLSLRTAMLCSLAVTQALDTALFSVLALYKVVPSLTSIMLFSYAIKMITLVSMTVLTPLQRKAA